MVSIFRWDDRHDVCKVFCSAKKSNNVVFIIHYILMHLINWVINVRLSLSNIKSQCNIINQSINQSIINVYGSEC